MPSLHRARARRLPSPKSATVKLEVEQWLLAGRVYRGEKIGYRTLAEKLGVSRNHVGQVIRELKKNPLYSDEELRQELCGDQQQQAVLEMPATVAPVEVDENELQEPEQAPPFRPSRPQAPTAQSLATAYEIEAQRQGRPTYNLSRAKSPVRVPFYLKGY